MTPVVSPPPKKITYFFRYVCKKRDGVTCLYKVVFLHLPLRVSCIDCTVLINKLIYIYLYIPLDKDLKYRHAAHFVWYSRCCGGTVYNIIYYSVSELRIISKRIAVLGVHRGVCCGAHFFKLYFAIRGSSVYGFELRSLFSTPSRPNRSGRG